MLVCVCSRVNVAGGAPKTSEYAYFRKVKDGAVNGHFRALQKENKQLKSSKINYLLAGKIIGS